MASRRWRHPSLEVRNGMQAVDAPLAGGAKWEAGGGGTPRWRWELASRRWRHPSKNVLMQCDPGLGTNPVWMKYLHHPSPEVRNGKQAVEALLAGGANVGLLEQIKSLVMGDQGPNADIKLAFSEKQGCFDILLHDERRAPNLFHGSARLVGFSLRSCLLASALRL